MQKKSKSLILPDFTGLYLVIAPTSSKHPNLPSVLTPLLFKDLSSLKKDSREKTIFFQDALKQSMEIWRRQKLVPRIPQTSVTHLLSSVHTPDGPYSPA